MSDWGAAFAELRSDYVRTTTAQLDDLARLLDALGRNGADGEALAELRRGFHSLAGSGGVFGFRDVSRACKAAEDDCVALAGGPGPAPSDLDRLRHVVETVRGKLLTPAVAPVEPAAAPPSVTATEPDAGARILSIEDDAGYAAYLTTLLTSAGYVVHVCTDPATFERDLSAFAPDLVLIDVLLPRTSGYDIGRLLRQNQAHATLPVLFLTSERQLQARIEGIAAGADDYMLKSDPPELLLATIGARLGRARLLTDLVERDGLTHLLTRAAFVNRLNEVIGQCRRDPSRGAALIMLDVDHFKEINDRYGHISGDQVLATLAALLRRRLRQSDIVGRYGGEEFAIVVPDADAARAVQLMTRLLGEFAAIDHRAPDGTGFHVTFSAGVALGRGPALDAHRWMSEADAALYAAKAAGRNRVLAAPPEA